MHGGIPRVTGTAACMLMGQALASQKPAESRDYERALQLLSGNQISNDAIFNSMEKIAKAGTVDQKTDVLNQIKKVMMRGAYGTHYSNWTPEVNTRIEQIYKTMAASLLMK